jgi:hypothetical protein
VVKNGQNKKSKSQHDTPQIPIPNSTYLSIYVSYLVRARLFYDVSWTYNQYTMLSILV